jgi:hypothetical protein
MNIYTLRILAIEKADIALRRPLLGLALQTESVRNKSNLLSGNSDVVFQSNGDGDQRAGVAAASVPVEIAASAPVEVASSECASRDSSSS